MPKYKNDPFETPIQMAEEFYQKQMAYVDQMLASFQQTRSMKIGDVSAEQAIETVVRELEG